MCIRDSDTLQANMIISLIIGSAFTVPLVFAWYRALSYPYHLWGITENRTETCTDGEHVQGVEYFLTIRENDRYPYYLTSIKFMCSSSTLGECIHRLQTHPQRCKPIAAVTHTNAKYVSTYLVGFFPGE